jgi:hypothetical protein
MPHVANDPPALLFTCERCGHWPLAYQGDDTARRQKRFVCPRCHAHIGYARTASQRLSAVAGQANAGARQDVPGS